MAEEEKPGGGKPEAPVAEEEKPGGGKPEAPVAEAEEPERGSGGNFNGKSAEIAEPMGMIFLEPVDALSLMATPSDQFELTTIVSEPLA